MTPGIIVISAPSAAGKNTLINALKQVFPNIETAITTTTRDPRPGEQNGKDYWFVTEKEFRSMIKKGALYEHANVHGNFYGTSRAAVEHVFSQGKTCVLIIDVQGARSIKKLFPQTTTIFIAPPSIEVLRERMMSRNAEAPDVIERRLQTAVEEMKAKDEFDYLIVNDDFDEARQKLQKLIKKVLSGS